jgi:prepilin-type processing-associated H-X9-DG protein
MNGEWRGGAVEKRASDDRLGGTSQFSYRMGRKTGKGAFGADDAWRSFHLHGTQIGFLFFDGHRLPVCALSGRFGIRPILCRWSCLR